MNQAAMRPVPRAAHTLAMLSAIGFALAMLINITCILNPAAVLPLFTSDTAEMAAAEIPLFATLGIIGVSLMPLPLLILAVHNTSCRQISTPSAKICAVLFGCFMLLPMLSGMCNRMITVFTARTAGSDALAKLSVTQNAAAAVGPLNIISYVLLGCSVAIITYAATLQSNFSTE